MGQCTSVYLDDDLRAAVNTSGVPLAELVRRGLAAGTASTAPASEPPPATAAAIAVTGPGEPSPGVVCMGPAAGKETRHATG